MFDKLSDNLNLLMAEVRISADELGRRTGVPASTIKKIRNRYSPNPTLTTLLPLAKFFAVSLDQLIGAAPLTIERMPGTYQDPKISLQKIPLLSWHGVISNETASEFVTTEYQYSDKTFALIIQEDNLENLSRDTILIVDPLVTAEHRDFIIVHKKSALIPTVKQLFKDEDDLYLKSLMNGNIINPLTAAHRIIGVVVEYKKQLKKETV